MTLRSTLFFKPKIAQLFIGGGQFGTERVSFRNGGSTIQRGEYNNHILKRQIVECDYQKLECKNQLSK